jgi:uncharacterized protein YqeY
MSLLERINEDLIKALKSGDRLAADTLRGLKSDVKYYQIEKRLKDVSDDDVAVVLSSAVKRRRDSIEQFAAGHREDLVAKETRELEMIKSYLPKELTEEEITALVTQSMAETGASSSGDIGKVMKVLMPKVRGKADGKLVKDIVTRMLS